MSNGLEKQVHYYSLFAFYGKLLTLKQQAYFQAYFAGNMSLQEIAEQKAVSRNAVYDSLWKVMKLLDNYEETLGLYQKYQARQKIYENNSKYDFIKKLQEIDKI